MGRQVLFDSGWGGGCCFRVVVTRTQLTKLVIERNQGRTISMCAMKAGMSRKTAGKYLSQDKVLEGPGLWDKLPNFPTWASTTS